jgi:nitrogen permease regulator 3-like protein
MAETLLAILLVTSSATGSSLVYRWPPCPKLTPRLCRPRPIKSTAQLDNPWRATRPSGSWTEGVSEPEAEAFVDEEEDYEWKRPNSLRDRSVSFSNSMSRSASPHTPHDGQFHSDGSQISDEYNNVLGYHSEFLANFLCPKSPLCHQKFELVVDDLAFIGHPVTAEPDGMWRFKPENAKSSARGREFRNRQHGEDSPSPSLTFAKLSSLSSWLHTFHFVIVLDLPDPSSSSSGNLGKYFDIIYEQVAFTVAAVLFQEQVLSNFVEDECDRLGSLRDAYIARGSFRVDDILPDSRSTM